MNEQKNTVNLGVTFQMSLDTFLEEVHPIKNKNTKLYEQALEKLEEGKKVRSFTRKQELAKQALQLCPDCIEAHMTLGLYETDYLKKIQYFKEGMELATMNLGKDFFLSERNDVSECEQAKPFFHIKFAYAEVLFEAGYMRKALAQFQEIINLNPADVFNAHHYVYVLYLYFEEYEACKQVLAQYDTQDTMSCYVHFLYALKNDQYTLARKMLLDAKKKNPYVFDLMTFQTMNMAPLGRETLPGSEAEARYVYNILRKVVSSMEYLHIYMIKNLQDETDKDAD